VFSSLLQPEKQTRVNVIRINKAIFFFIKTHPPKYSIKPFLIVLHKNVKKYQRYKNIDKKIKYSIIRI
jgi:hypothetical protein